MKARKSFWQLMAVVSFLGSVIPPSVLANPLYKVTNVSPGLASIVRMIASTACSRSTTRRGAG